MKLDIDNSFGYKVDLFSKDEAKTEIIVDAIRELDTIQAMWLVKLISDYNISEAIDIFNDEFQ